MNQQEIMQAQIKVGDLIRDNAMQWRGVGVVVRVDPPYALNRWIIHWQRPDNYGKLQTREEIDFYRLVTVDPKDPFLTIDQVENQNEKT
tara:strand:+ start:358 stop:624 length:267 start_codon:yes stop_codon:yes gene_type:complete